MGNLQNMLTAVLPDAWMAAMESESREWVMRCPCGHETSVWEMGGIRFKAAGNPRRMGRCTGCGRSFWGQVYRRDEVGRNGHSATNQANTGLDGETSAMSGGTRSSHPSAGPAPVLFWIDGVGCWCVVQKDQFTIGGPARPRDGSGCADLSLLADLSREHAVITRCGESYLFQADGPAQVDSVRATAPVPLTSGQTIRLGDSVQFRFLQPNALSATARLEFVSGHRPARRVDGIILLEQACILGPTADCHIVCPGWTRELVLFRRDGRLCVKKVPDLFVNGCRADADVVLRDGTVVSSEDLRLRVELERQG